MTGTESHISGPQTAFVRPGTGPPTPPTPRTTAPTTTATSPPRRCGPATGCSTSAAAAATSPPPSPSSSAPTATSSASTPSPRCSRRPGPGPGQPVVRPQPGAGPRDAFGPEHDATFDVVLSRAVLHWVPAADLPDVYRSAARLEARRVVPRGVRRRRQHPQAPRAHGRRVRRSGRADRARGTSPTRRRPSTGSRPPASTPSPTPGLRALRRPAAARSTRRPSPAGSTARSSTPTRRGCPRPPRRVPPGRKARLEELRRADGTFDQTWVRLDLLARRP